MVQPASGYNFTRDSNRKLFAGGTEAARLRCLDLAQAFGILDLSEE